MFNQLTFNQFYRRIMLSYLGRIRHGQITLVEKGEETTVGESSDLHATIYVVRDRMFRRVVTGGGIGLAEALMDGDFRCDDLTALVRILIRNMAATERFDGPLSWISNALSRLRHSFRHNSRSNSKRNIEEHYDLGNDFYSLFLDPTMNYSCGVFEHPEATMMDASLAKIDRACRKLDLKPHDHLLEIGTGWGSLAVYAAETFGCRVTTTTISEEQFTLASRRVHEAGLSDRVTVLKKDYRDLTGTYDKLVSIEMIEAVGHQYLRGFFQKCGELLAPEGSMLLQAIVMADHYYDEYLYSADFIRRYIFPGGELPSISLLTTKAADAASMRMLHLEDYAPHYAETLRRWRVRFNEELDAVKQLGFSERFIRMWDYYFAYCEAAFDERRVNVVQMLLGKEASRFDPVPLSLQRTKEANRVEGAWA